MVAPTETCKGWIIKKKHLSAALDGVKDFYTIASVTDKDEPRLYRSSCVWFKYVTVVFFCLIVVPLPPGENQFAVNNNNNNKNKNKNIYRR
jgi:hypothetical protein